MSKKHKLVTVERCLCEVLEQAEWGVVLADMDRVLSYRQQLVVAPDGLLFIECEGLVSTHSPFWQATEYHLRRLARALV